MVQKNSSDSSQKHCYFCQHGIKEIDYKDVALLRRGISSFERILPRKKTGFCALHQRKLARAIKRARFMALIPYVKQ